MCDNFCQYVIGDYLAMHNSEMLNNIMIMQSIIILLIIFSCLPYSQLHYSWVPSLDPKPAILRYNFSCVIVVMEQSLLLTAFTDLQRWVEWPTVSNRHNHFRPGPTLLSVHWSPLQYSINYHDNTNWRN